MDDGRPRRRRNWLRLALVTIAVPVLAFVGLLLAIGLGWSGSY